MRVNCPNCSAHADVTMKGPYRNAQDLGSSDFHCVMSPGNAGTCPHLRNAIKAAIDQNDERRPIPGV
jgi:hypothetical protein